MVNTKLSEMFETFTKINNDMMRQGEILEIAVKQHQIRLCIDSKIFYLSDALSLTHDALIVPNNTYVTGFEDPTYVIIDNIPDNLPKKSCFLLFLDVIKYMREHICACPELEFVISSQYIKCFLDKPGLKLENISKLEELFGDKCTLELTSGRPYALFVNIWM